MGQPHPGSKYRCHEKIYTMSLILPRQLPILPMKEMREAVPLLSLAQNVMRSASCLRICRGNCSGSDTWTEAPVTDEQKQYLESEAVYRDFVYVNLSYSRSTVVSSVLIKELFHKEEEEASLSVYAAVQQNPYLFLRKIRIIINIPYLRKILRETILLKEFLQGEREGNAAALYFCCRTCTEKLLLHHPARICRRISSCTGKQAENSHGLGSAFLLLTVMPGRKYIWMVWDGYR